MMKLYYMPGTIALASHIALIEAGADHAIEKVDFTVSRQRSPEYLKLNPKGRVPALDTPHGTLTETPAILAYIAMTHPRAALAPVDDPFQFARCQAFNSYFCSTIHVAHAHRMRGSRWVDEPEAIAAMQRKVPQSVLDGFSVVEEALAAGPWLLGQTYSICDPYLFTLSGWLEADGVDPRRLPRVLEHRQRMGERASVRRALAEQAS
jgi:glutathione S-transferase